MSDLHEYAFDVKLASVVRVLAENEESARAKLRDIDAVDFSTMNQISLRITEISVDDVEPSLFEIDGIDQDE